MQFHMAFIQYSTTTIVAINRMTLMCYPGFFKKSWSSYGWIIMVLIVILPFSVTYHVFLHDAYFQYNATFDRFSLESEYPSFILFSRLFYFMCACSSITIIVNVMTFHKIRSLWYKPDNLEVNYFLVTFVASVVQIIGTLLTYAMIIATPNTALFRMTNVALPFVSDALTLLQPILLVIFCKAYATTAIISMNRLTILVDHIFFEPLWRKYSFVLIFFVYFLPFISTGQLFESTCRYGNRTDGTFVLSCSLPTSILFTPLIIFQVGCMVCSIICNATSFFIVLRASKEIKVKMEINFLILISVTTAVMLLGAVISLYLSNYPKGSMYNIFHTYLLPIISDLFTIMHPWLLYILSKPVKNYVNRDVFRMKTSTVEVIPHNSRVGSHQNNLNGSRVEIKF
ncbi:unnamed protein product [Caenorhabditis brenneri]